MKHICIIAALAFCAVGCSSKKTENAPTIEDQKTDSFFPLTSYLKGQMMILDSIPITPLQITTIKGKSDSAWISKEKIKTLLAPFLHPVVTETNFSTYFKETRFIDQTLNAITFTYDPIKALPDSLSLRHWDIYIDPEKGNITKVYMVKQAKQGDKDYTWQLTWQSNEYAKISTIMSSQDGKRELVKEDLFKWRF